MRRSGSHPEPLDPFTLRPDVLDQSVLVVDDENGVRDLMSRWLQAGGYSVAKASDALEALGLMETFPPAVALCDIRMPGRDGLWLADRIRQQFPETAVIMATGVHDAVAAAASLGDGVVDYLTKPFGRERLRDAVTRGIEWHRFARESRCWREKLGMEVEIRRSSLASAMSALTVDSDDALDAMFSMLTIGERDAYAHGHRVAALAVQIAERLGVRASHLSTIRLAALLHDIGKLAIPDALLRKPAPLTPEERQIVRRYPEIGSELLSCLTYLAETAPIVRDAQERPDGSGYPAGLAARCVPLGARIVAVADAFDTMTHTRLYRDALTVGDALLELERCAGAQFDTAVVQTFKGIVG